MTRPLQTLGVLLLGGLAVGLPWLTGVTAGAAWLSAHRAIVETPLTTLAVAAFGLTGAAVALAEPWLGAFVVWAGLSLFRIGWPGMTEAVLPIALGAVMIVGLQRVPPVLDLRAWGARRGVVRPGGRPPPSPPPPPPPPRPRAGGGRRGPARPPARAAGPRPPGVGGTARRRAAGCAPGACAGRARLPHPVAPLAPRRAGPGRRRADRVHRPATHRDRSDLARLGARPPRAALAGDLRPARALRRLPGDAGAAGAALAPAGVPGRPAAVVFGRGRGRRRARAPGPVAHA